MIALLPPLMGILAGPRIAGTTIPTGPDGQLTFDYSDESGGPTTGSFFTFTYADETGGPVPDIV